MKWTLILPLILFEMVQSANGDVIPILTTIDGHNNTTVEAGQTFVLNVDLSVNSDTSPFNGTSINAFDLYLNTAGTDSNGDFTIQSGGVTLNPGFSFLFSPPTLPVTIPATGNGTTDLENAKPDSLLSVPVTNINLEQLTLTVSPNTLPGIYTIETSYGTEIIDNNYGDNFQTMPGSFDVTVAAPEISTTPALLLGLLTLSIYGICAKVRLRR